MTCRDMDDFLNLEPCELRPPESLLQGIKLGIAEDLRPIRPLPPFRVLLFGCVIVFLSMVAVGALLLGVRGWGALSMVQRLDVFVTLGGSAVLLATSMLRQMAPGSKHVVAPSALLVAIPVVFIVMIAATFRSQHEPAFLASGVMCLKNGLAYSLPAAFLLWLILRRGAILYPKVVGAVAGGLAGFAGLSVLEVNCPNLNALHILVWHGGVVAISSAGGALLGSAVEFIERPCKPKTF